MVGVRRIAEGLCAKRMCRDALVLVVDVDGPAVIVNVHLLPDEVQAHRDAVVVLVQADVSVLQHRGDASLLDLEPDGVQRSHARALDLLVLFTAAVVPAFEVRVVVDLQGDTDGSVQTVQVVELPIFHHRVDCPVDQLDSSFDQGLVAGPADAGGHGRAAIVFGKGGEVLVQLGLILVRVGDRRLQVVRHDDLGRSAVEIESVLARVNEVLLLLAHHGFHVGKLRTGEDGHEDFDRGFHSGLPVH